MDFNLSSICDMLGDRIEEYKTTAKKRRIERGSCAPKPKMAKTSAKTHHAMENSAKKQNGVTSRMYASTPLASPSAETERFPSCALFSCIGKTQTPSTTSRLAGKANTNARKLTFDDTEGSSDTKVIEKSIIEESPASFASATKVISPETIMRRRLQRTRANVRRLFADDDDQNVEESSSKSQTWSEDRPKEEPYKTMKSFSKNTPISGTGVLTPMNTPRRERLPRKCMKARKLTFEDEENVNTTFFECSSNDCSEDSTVQDIEGFDSTILVLNVGICIRPIIHL